MKTIIRLAVTLSCLLLVSGCATSSGPRAIPSKDTPQCQFDEQLVCSGKSATRIKGEGNDVEFCHCQRLEQVR